MIRGCNGEIQRSGQLYNKQNPKIELEKRSYHLLRCRYNHLTVANYTASDISMLCEKDAVDNEI